MSDRTAVIDKQAAIDSLERILKHWEFHSVAPLAVADCIAALSRLPESRPTPGSEDDETLLSAPCRWCGYNGGGYYQTGSHEPNCPWFNIGGQSGRITVLKALRAPASVGAGTPPTCHSTCECGHCNCAHADPDNMPCHEFRPVPPSGAEPQEDAPRPKAICGECGLEDHATNCSGRICEGPVCEWERAGYQSCKTHASTAASVPPSQGPVVGWDLEVVTSEAVCHWLRGNGYEVVAEAIETGEQLAQTERA